MNSTREGFSMVEVLVAMVLLAIILTTLAGFTFSTAQRALVASDATTREALLLETVNRYNSMPFATMQSACDTVGTQRNRYRRCADVSVAAANRSAEVVVTITPLQRNVPPSQTRFVRAGQIGSSPLCLSGNCSP